jgi:putative transposase
MSLDEKVARVAAAHPAFGLNQALRVIGLAKSTWHYRQTHVIDYAQKRAHLRQPLEAIARTYPEYGYRRATPELRARLQQVINHKVVQRLHQTWDLLVLRGARRPRPSGIRRAIASAGERVNLVAGLTAIDVLQVAYTDFTELVYAHGQRKAQLLPILDHHSKVALGWALGERAVTELALQAWQRVKRSLRRWGQSWQGMLVHHDQDPVFTGYGWTAQLLLRDQVRVSYAVHGARDNPEMEAFNSRFKDENRSLFLEANTLSELGQVVEARMQHYNHRRRHSSIGYVPPMTYLKQVLRSRP